MGDLKLSKNSKYKQGYYYPKNMSKFKGKLPYAVHRSGLELKYFRILDDNPNVIEWGSEEVVVPYEFDGRWHRYYIDLYVKFRVKDKIKKFIIELKPFKQTQEPVWSNRRKQSSYLYECKEWQRNCAKWRFAKDFAAKHDVEFHILTEKDLESYGK